MARLCFATAVLADLAVLTALGVLLVLTSDPCRLGLRVRKGRVPDTRLALAGFELAAPAQHRCRDLGDPRIRVAHYLPCTSPNQSRAPR